MLSQQSASSSHNCCRTKPLPSVVSLAASALGRHQSSCNTSWRLHGATNRTTCRAFTPLQSLATGSQHSSSLNGYHQLSRPHRHCPSHARIVVVASTAARSSEGEEPARRGRQHGRQHSRSNGWYIRSPAGGTPHSRAQDNRWNIGGNSSDPIPGDSKHRHEASPYRNNSRHNASSRYPGSAPAGGRQLGGTIGRQPQMNQKARSVKLISMDVMACDSVEQLQRLVQQDGAQMDYINLSAAIVKLQKILSRLPVQQQQHLLQSQALLDQLWQLQQPKLSQCAARQLANMVYAFCQLPPELQQQYQQAVTMQLLPAFMQQLLQADPQNVANVLYAIGKSGAHLEAKHTQRLVAQLVEVVAAANPQNIPNAAWAVATMGQQAQPGMIQQLLQAFANLGHTAKPQEFANIVWAVAAMGQQVQPQMLQQLLHGFASMGHIAKPQEFANIFWAVATMGQQVQPHMLQRLLRGFASTAHTAKPQNISNILWAVATMGQQLEAAQLQQMLDALVDMSHHANPQDISNTLWAVSRMQHTADTRQMQELLRVLVGKLGHATSQDVSTTLLACARFGYLPEQLLRAPGTLSKLLADTPQGLANAAWACGELGYRDEQLMAAIIKTAVKQSTGQHSGVAFDDVVQHPCNMCWSVSVLDLQQHAADVLLLAQKCPQQWGQMVPEDFSQLYQVHLWLLDHQLAGGQGLLGALTEQQLQQCKATWIELMSMGASAVAGTFQQSVFTALQQLSSSGRLELLELPQMEQVSLGRDGQPDGAALIDMTARTADGVMLAIEADGPTHFRRPDGGLRGATLYRNRALAVRGYTIVSIPHYEWPWGNNQAQQECLLQQIQVAVKAQRHQQQRLQAELGTPARAHKPADGGQLSANSAAGGVCFDADNSSSPGVRTEASKAGGTTASSSTAAGDGRNSSRRVRRVGKRT